MNYEIYFTSCSRKCSCRMHSLVRLEFKSHKYSFYCSSIHLLQWMAWGGYKHPFWNNIEVNYWWLWFPFFTSSRIHRVFCIKWKLLSSLTMFCLCFVLTMKFIQCTHGSFIPLKSEIFFECRNLLLQVGSSVLTMISDSLNLNLRRKKKKESTIYIYCGHWKYYKNLIFPFAFRYNNRDFPSFDGKYNFKHSKIKFPNNNKMYRKNPWLVAKYCVLCVSDVIMLWMNYTWISPFSWHHFSSLKKYSNVFIASIEPIERCSFT